MTPHSFDNKETVSNNRAGYIFDPAGTSATALQDAKDMETTAIIIVETVDEFIRAENSCTN